MSLAAVIAVLLALVGVFGVVSYLVSRRTRELGIRVALGAENRAVLTMVLWQGFKIAGLGATVGLLTALLLGQGMAGLLFGVSPTDPFVLGGVVAALLLTCLLATYVPARRATRVDPMEAIRYE
jgi:ABC-type antimicrobial peptide transport system permease subunit